MTESEAASSENVVQVLVGMRIDLKRPVAIISLQAPDTSKMCPRT